MWNEIARWWKDRPRPSQLALGALLLLCVSQFFTYYVPRNWGTLSISSNFNTVGHYYFDPVKGGTGWAIHPWAPHVLMLLAALHGSSISESRHFRRFGYWLSLPLMFGALTPGSISMPGGKMGVTALCLMLLAAIWNWRLGRRVPPPPA
jgi:hypothetical protein